MPVIEMKANVPVNEEQKKALAAGFVKAFADAGEDAVSHNLLVEIEGGRWIDFREDCGRPAALVSIRPGKMTPEKDYALIVAGCFAALKGVLPEIPHNRVYMTVAENPFWGWDGKLL